MVVAVVTYDRTKGKGERLYAVLQGAGVKKSDYFLQAASSSQQAISVARSIAADGEASVALVMDARTTDPEFVTELRDELSGSIAMVRPVRSYLVYLFEPSIERVTESCEDNKPIASVLVDWILEQSRDLRRSQRIKRRV